MSLVFLSYFLNSGSLSFFIMAMVDDLNDQFGNMGIDEEENE